MRRPLFAHLLNRWTGLAALQVLALVLLYFHWPPVELTLLVPEEEQQEWQTLIQTFQAQHPKTKIRLITTQNLGGYLTKQLKENTCLPKGSPDLVYLDVIWVPEFAERKCLKDLSSRLTSKLRSQFTPQSIADGEFSGKLYRIPFRSDVGMLFYRADLLAQAGYQQPPTTYADLIEMSQAIQRQNLAEWGFLWQGDRYEGQIATFVEVLKGHGGFWINPQTLAVGLDQPQAIQAVQFLRKTLKTRISPSSVLTYSEVESLEQFKAGNTVFLRHWPRGRALLNAPDSQVAGKVKAVPMGLQRAGQQGAACNGSWGLGMSQTTQYPRQAWQAIRFFARETAQRQFTRETRFIPGNHEVVQQQESPVIQQAIASAVKRPPIPEYDQASEVLQAGLSQALNLDTPDDRVAEIMQTTAAETRQLLQSPS